jgi:hypothetical protein
MAAFSSSILQEQPKRREKQPVSTNDYVGSMKFSFSIAMTCENQRPESFPVLCQPIPPRTISARWSEFTRDGTKDPSWSAIPQESFEALAEAISPCRMRMKACTKPQPLDSMPGGIPATFS